MTEFVPFEERQNGNLKIRLRPESEALRSITLSCVVDLTYLGEVVGLEVLDFGRQLSGARAPVSPRRGGIRWSYDAEVDAFYLHVADGPGQVQRKERAVAYLGSDDQLSALELRIPTVG
jgi:hypothetical protein